MPAAPAAPTIPSEDFSARLMETMNQNPITPADADAMRRGGNPEPKPAPQPEAKPQPVPEPKPEAKTPEVKPEPKVDDKPKPKASDLLTQLQQPEKKTEESKKPEDAPKPAKADQKEFNLAQLRKKADEAEEYQKQLEDYKAKLSKYDGVDLDALNKKIADNEKVVEEYERKLAAADVMQSKAYTDNVTLPMEAIWSDLSKAAETYKFPLNELAAALAIQDHRAKLAKVSQVLDSAEGELDPLNKADLVNAVHAFLQREHYGKQLIANSTEAKKALEADKARREGEEKQARSQKFDDQADYVFQQMFRPEMLEAMPWLAPKDENGKPVFDKKLSQEIRASAKDEGDQPYQHALKSYSAMLLPMAMNRIDELEAKNKEYEDRISQLSGAGPRAGGAINPEDGGGDPNKGKDFKTLLEDTMRANGQIR